jgi:hypothetical protein
MILRGQGDAVEGERLVAVGRKITKPIVIPATARHRGVRAIVYGLPARCYVDKVLRLR